MNRPERKASRWCRARSAISGAQADLTVYHYHPEPGLVRAWLAEAGLEVEEAGTVVGYAHIIAKKVSIIGD
jgi:hypothetical protein